MIKKSTSVFSFNKVSVTLIVKLLSVLTQIKIHDYRHKALFDIQNDAFFIFKTTYNGVDINRLLKIGMIIKSIP